MNLKQLEDLYDFKADFFLIHVDYRLVKDVLVYIKTNKGLGRLPDSIRNRDDALVFIKVYNQRVIDLNKIRLRLKEYTYMNFFELWKYLVLDKSEVNIDYSYLKEKRYIKVYGIDQRIDLHEYL